MSTHKTLYSAFNGRGAPLGNVQLNGRFKNKFQQGFLGGTGGDSQFAQAAGRTLPVSPYNSNRDLEQRVAQSTGTTVAGVPLLPSWHRSYAFAVGRGIDAAQSKITHTPAEAGLVNPFTGQTVPLVNAGLDRTTDGPMPQPWSSVGVGQASMLEAPHISRDGPVRVAPRKKQTPQPTEVRVVK